MHIKRFLEAQSVLAQVVAVVAQNIYVGCRGQMFKFDMYCINMMYTCHVYVYKI